MIIKGLLGIACMVTAQVGAVGADKVVGTSFFESVTPIAFLMGFVVLQFKGYRDEMAVERAEHAKDRQELRCRALHQQPPQQAATG